MFHRLIDNYDFLLFIHQMMEHTQIVKIIITTYAFYPDKMECQFLKISEDIFRNRRRNNILYLLIGILKNKYSFKKIINFELLNIKK